LLEAEGKGSSHPISHQTWDSMSCSHRPRKQRSCEEHVEGRILWRQTLEKTWSWMLPESTAGLHERT
jgi:hypothetical protein